MVTLSLLNLCFFVLIDHVKAPNSLAESAEGIPPSSQDPISNSKPTLPVVIAFLSILFWLTLTLLLYAKFCRPTTTSSLDDTTVQIQDGLLRSRSPAASAGIDKKVVESLPFFRFSCLKGSREGLECAVCLAKFQDIEILRLLPKCKHAFHIDCIDLWLEKHSTCPLCRQGVGADDFSQLPYSDSLRFLWNIDDQLRDQESNIVLELYVEREEENLHGSSRFSIGSISLRRLCEIKRNYKEEYLIPIQHDHGGNKKACLNLNKLKHKINVVSDDHVVFKNRWSNVSSSDLMYLNSEMVIDSSSARFSSLLDSGRNDHDQRSMSEIVVHPRFSTDHELISTVAQTNVEEKRMRRLWLPIARRTVQWFADREMRHPQSQNHV